MSEKIPVDSWLLRVRRDIESVTVTSVGPPVEEEMNDGRGDPDVFSRSTRTPGHYLGGEDPCRQSYPS